MAAIPGVYQCIANVSAEVAKTGIAKDGRNVQQGYPFRGIDAVMNTLAPLLAKHGLVILPRMLARSVVERATKNGGVLFSVTVEMEFDFVCAADGSVHTVRMFGEAMDSADKATNKAASASYKYAAFQTFCIPTEGDADAVTHEPVPTSTVRPAAERPAADPAPTLAPSGYHAWFDRLRGAAMLGLPTLEREWVAAPKDFRIYLAATTPGAQAELKAIASRMVKATGGLAS